MNTRRTLMISLALVTGACAAEDPTSSTGQAVEVAIDEDEPFPVPEPVPDAGPILEEDRADAAVAVDELPDADDDGLVRHCGDAVDEAELKSEIAEATADLELAKAHMLRHRVRIAELEADQKLNDASIKRLPTDRKLKFQLAANGIAGLLELSAIRNLARGRAVKNTSTANTCVTATAGEVKLSVASGTGTVWRPPTGKQIGTQAIKLGAGMWIQQVNDNGVERIPVIGVVTAIGRAGAELMEIDDVRKSMEDFGKVLEKAVEMEQTEKKKWEDKVEEYEQKLEELKEKLAELKKRPADDEEGEVSMDVFDAVELEEETPMGPFI